MKVRLLLTVAALCLGLTVQAQATPSARKDSLFPIPVAKKWGFIDRNGKQVFTPKFDQIGTYAEGIWPVRVGKKWGFIRERQEGGSYFSVEPRFDALGRFSEGLCAAKSGPKWGYIGKNGRWQIAPQFVENGVFSSEMYAVFSEGLASVEVSDNLASKNGWSDTRGYIDRKGNWVYEPQFAMADPFSEGMASVTIYDESTGDTNDVFVRREQGKTFSLIHSQKDERWIEVEPFMEGMAAIRVVRGQQTAWGFIDKTGKWAIEPKYLAVLGIMPDELRVGFRVGLALVATGDTAQNVRLGWIDQSGNWEIEPIFNGGGAPFMDGLAPVSIPSENGPRLGGWINKTGAWAIKPHFEQMGIFTDGVAPAREPKGKWGYIDRRGEWVIQPAFEYVSLYEAPAPILGSLQFRDGLAWVKEGRASGYIDKNRNWVWKQK